MFKKVVMGAAENICGTIKRRGRPGGGMKKGKGCNQEMTEAGWKQTEGGL